MSNTNLPQWKCHKVVRAAKIEAINGYTLDFEADLSVDVSHGWFQKNNPQVGGYYVEYEDGYTSYSPPDAFEKGYTRLVATPTGHDFGVALALLRAGKKVQRSGWNGKGLWLEMQVPDAHSKMTLPYIFISYPADAQNTPGARVPWLASQTDMLASDWVIVE